MLLWHFGFTHSLTLFPFLIFCMWFAMNCKYFMKNGTSSVIVSGIKGWAIKLTWAVFCCAVSFLFFLSVNVIIFDAIMYFCSQTDRLHAQCSSHFFFYFEKHENDLSGAPFLYIFKVDIVSDFMLPTQMKAFWKEFMPLFLGF